MSDELYNAVHRGDLNALKAVGERNPSLIVSYRESNGETLLHQAVRRPNNVAVLRYLVQMGISVEAKDGSDWRPLHEAANNNVYDAAHFLLEEGADLDAKRKDQKTALDILMQWDNPNPELLNLLKTGVKAWSLDDADILTHRTFIRSTNHRLLEVFNFRARTYMAISANLGSGSEAMTLKTFEEIAGSFMLDEATTEFTKLGGVVPDTSPYTQKINKKSFVIQGV